MISALIDIDPSEGPAMIVGSACESSSTARQGLRVQGSISGQCTCSVRNFGTGTRCSILKKYPSGIPH